MISITYEPGPTDNSNWLLKTSNGGGLIQGGYPNPSILNRGKHLTDLLIEAGVTIFISLLTEEDMANHNVHPYCNLVHDLKCYSLPIKDRDVICDKSLMDLVEFILFEMLRGNIIYLHCWGGHGRSGTVSIALLMRLGLDLKSAVTSVNTAHSYRLVRNRVNFQGKGPQYNQVKRIQTTYINLGYIKK